MILNQLFSKVLTEDLQSLSYEKSLINTINAHSYNLAKKDLAFMEALQGSDVILADGIAVVWVYKLLNKKIKKIAGSDLFHYEMNRLERQKGSCFFLGSSEVVLARIRERAKLDFPNVYIRTYSPSYKDEFSTEENEQMVAAINQFNPDVLFVGMTAPKQEKWAYRHFATLKAEHVCCIGAVFDFYASSVSRPPKWMISMGLEWLGRLLKEPKRMWRRYLVSSPVIFWDILLYKIKGS